MALTDQTRIEAAEIIARYPQPRSALLPMLHLVQSEEGYVTPEGIALCAEMLGLTKAEVGAVATFYTMYKRRPAGEVPRQRLHQHARAGCSAATRSSPSCRSSSASHHDETTEDGTITLEHAECLAACDYAPVVTVNYEFYDQQTPESASELVSELRGGRTPGRPPAARRCAPSSEISRQLAGFDDQDPEAVRAGPAGTPTLVGAQLAADRGETAPSYDPASPISTEDSSKGGK